jgi:hypothetical protein
MLGRPLVDAIAGDKPVRQAGIFGLHGRHVNVTDGRYVYMRGSADVSNRPLSNYTLMPTHMNCMFSPEELSQIELAEPFSFTKGCRTMKIDATAGRAPAVLPPHETMLWDVVSDPKQEKMLSDAGVEARMIAHLQTLMRECDAPPEQYERLGLAGSS